MQRLCALGLSPLLRTRAATRLSCQLLPRRHATTAVPPALPPRYVTSEEFELIAKRDGELRARHDCVASTFPASSQPPSAPALDTLAAHRKRLLYRSKQRGWLEVDLLLGTWAAKHLHGLSAAELLEYEAFLNKETVDIYNILTGKEAPPPELQGPLMSRLLLFVASSPLGKASAEGYAAAKGGMSN